jgi:glycosyltransferase involved in cell wall biosynthesis
MRDPETLTAAIKLVWQEKPEARLIAIGTARSAYIWAAPELDDDRLQVLDDVDDTLLLRAYHAASIAILSLHDAVANNALLEAMACGLPVVASDVGGVREYLGEEAGLIVPPWNPEALAEAILALLDDPVARRRMGRAARERTLDLDHRVAAQRLTEVYRKVRAMG